MNTAEKSSKTGFKLFKQTFDYTLNSFGTSVFSKSAISFVLMFFGFSSTALVKETLVDKIIQNK
ncbi:hypothetical protein QTG56_04005 [Rossellomorea sp. AcN35-11]|nr:hypothetical protein [Rossellomorea aquimaris]WJV30300.1 hypothetical protein QTG56_04005 [Rossellomorea sp. AcN35-11]